jgi:hypothetical protein
MYSHTTSDHFSFLALGLVLALSNGLFLQQVLTYAN